MRVVTLGKGNGILLGRADSGEAWNYSVPSSLEGIWPLQIEGGLNKINLNEEEKNEIHVVDVIKPICSINA